MDTLNLSSMRNLSSFSPVPIKSKPRLKSKMVNVVSALKRGNSYESQHLGRLVDENMIVLRKRIHEMKIIERNYEPPIEWMEWEKQMYVQYDEHICTILGMVQAQLMNIRPSVALGALALLTMSVPTSVILLALHFVEATEKIIKL